MVTGKRIAIVTGFENYRINEKGQIYTLNYYYPDIDYFGILSCRIDRAGYYTVRLQKDKKSYTLYLHRLLALEFLPNPENKGFINHKDAVKTNNNLNNLEWVTHSENIKHAYSLGLMKGREKPVIDTQSGKQYKSVKEAAAMNGIPYTTCKNYLNGKRPNPTTLKYVV